MVEEGRAVSYTHLDVYKRQGYSGTAIFAKKEPLNVQYGIGIEEHDQEGRVITLEYENFYMVTVYTPNSQSCLLYTSILAPQEKQ